MAAATALAGRGDHALALPIIEAGLACHPASAALATLRQAVLHRLMDADQQLAPFRFVVYSDLSATETGPIG